MKHEIRNTKTCGEMIGRHALDLNLNINLNLK